jgi:predicted oxidoreductase
MERISLSHDLQFSRIAHGLWRLSKWGMTAQERLRFVEEALDLGVTTFDNADIYGDYSCEMLFGEIFKLQPALRNRLELVTKCGIKIKSASHPDRRIGHYDTSYEHIVRSTDQSLQNLRTDRIDVLLLHRPDPLIDPEEVARAFEHLNREGKVRYFGVSNFNPMQFEMLQRYCSGKLVTNQVEFSPWCLEHFHNGNVDFFLKEQLVPMAWSPFSGGKIFNPTDEQGERLQFVLEEIASEAGAYGIDLVALAWILKHPARFVPIIGSGKIERLQRATDALEITLTREHWYRILVASQGHPMP